MDDAQEIWRIYEHLLQDVPLTTMESGAVVKTTKVGAAELLLSTDGALLDIWVATKVFSMWKLADGKPDLVSFKRGESVDELRRAASLN